MKQGQFVTKYSIGKISLVRARSGQAMIEYVLLLVISVSMVLMAKSLFSGMGKFMDGYMGNYVRCLMEHGELPAFGAQNSDINVNPTTGYICAKQFSYSVSKGFVGDGSGGLGGRGGSSSSSSANANKSSSSSSSRNRNGEDSSASASDGTTSGSSEDSIAGRERRRKRSGSSDNGSGGGAGGNSSSFNKGLLRTADGDDGATGSNQPRVVRETGKGDANNLSDSEMGRGGRSRRYVTAITGKLAEEIEKNSKSAQTSSKLKNAESRIISESESPLGPKRSFVKQQERKIAVEQEEEKSSFGMGQLFKYILIIALIIIIVIFFGGQLLNYSKSD